MAVRTLLYHDVVPDGRWTESGFPERHAEIYKFAVNDFASHLRTLLASGSAPTLITDNPTSGWMLTFDDGGISARTRITPSLEAYGWRGHFFMTTGRIGTLGFLNRFDLREMAARGHVMGSHSVTHPLAMSSCSHAVLREEWRISVDTLAQILGAAVITASIPGGAFSDTVAETAGEAGIRVLFTSEPTAKSWMVGAVTCIGRYTLWRGMTADAALALATGRGLWPARQRVEWTTKKLLKAALGNHYLSLRAHLLH
jgi:peptidoglycan/xylan/chitin deacetylase (PgdA/CDA1 family)